MGYSKETVKENLELNDIYDILDVLNAEPQIFGDYIVAKTICHHGDTNKLYYYDNTQLFRCYSGDCGTFDIFELVQKVKHIDDLNTAIYFVVNFFNLQSKITETDEDYTSEDWKIFSRHNKVNDITPDTKETILLPEFDLSIFQYYPQPTIKNWEQEGISKEICDFMDIRYDPVNGNVLIPHYDVFSRPIGMRSRTLVQENEKYGKYKPFRHNNILYNHPLAFNLYGLDKAKHNIERMQVAIVVESEKAVLQYLSYFGIANDICVAVCGSSLSKYQFQLLQEAGAKEIVIAFDRDFEELGSDEYWQVESKLEKIYSKFGASANISFLFDKECNQLGYKNSPLDCGPEKFLYLWRNRVVL